MAPGYINSQAPGLHATTRARALASWTLPRLLRLVIPHAEHGDQDQAGADDEEDTDREENGEHRVTVSECHSVSQRVALMSGASHRSHAHARARLMGFADCRLRVKVAFSCAGHAGPLQPQHDAALPRAVKRRKARLVDLV
jgi:hypothetical protein